jgi:uncharacterized protein YjbJ (UPF0337 family)
MDEIRVEGTARNLGGKVQEGFGKVTGNARIGHCEQTRYLGTRGNRP